MSTADASTLATAAISMAQCRELARGLRAGDAGASAVRHLRPRGVTGLFSLRPPVALQFWLASRRGLLVRLGEEGQAPWALLEPPRSAQYRIRGYGRGYRVLAAVGRWWDVLLGMGIALLLVCVSGASLLLGVQPRPWMFVPPLIALVWVVASFTAVLITQSRAAWRTVEHADDTEDVGADLLRAQHWIVDAACCAPPDLGAVLEATFAAQSEVSRRHGLGTRGGLAATVLVEAEGVGVLATREALRDLPDVLCERHSRRGTVVLVGTPGQDAVASRPVTAAGAGVILLGAVAILLLLPLVLVLGDSGCIGGDESCLDTVVRNYPGVLAWIVEQLTWQSTVAPPVIPTPGIFAALLRVLGVVLLGVLAVAVARVWGWQRFAAGSVERAVGGGAHLPTVAIITALPDERLAMQVLLERARDHDRDGLVVTRGTLPSAHRIPHQVVLVGLHEGNNAHAGALAAQVCAIYPSVSQLLVSGIACGIPNPASPGKHVRRGDIVAGVWGVVAYDHVDEHPDGRVLRAQPRPPGRQLVEAEQWLQREEVQGRRPWEALLDRGIGLLPGSARPDADVLRDVDGLPTQHPQGSGHRPGHPTVHRGIIGSGDRALHDAHVRQELATTYDLLALEMEAQGVGAGSALAGVDYLVIRGISDYGDDSDTQDRTAWRANACLVAAAYTVSVLAALAPQRPRLTPLPGPRRV
ncbi:MAG: hypothetical protein ACK5MT_19360 [Actinomycetales bacterium]